MSNKFLLILIALVFIVVLVFAFDGGTVSPDQIPDKLQRIDTTTPSTPAPTPTAPGSPTYITPIHVDISGSLVSTNCKNISECMANIDKSFVGGIFK